ncbi:NAD(P)/FAD-dependent oxidoreductase [Novosphingobium sp.]|uniref:flavin-containing monooxygenase n=1 Tax=Novosphingobium sp. TaxID=1874826 RepID=UPI00333E4764
MNSDTGDILAVETLVIGGGQAGIATSEHLGRHGCPHLVVERARIAERWRSGRWDSLVANGPAWHDRFPNQTFDQTAPDAFAPKEEVAAYFERYAAMIDAPIRTGVAVRRLSRRADGQFMAETDGDAAFARTIVAKNVVVATGPFHHPVIPPMIPAHADVTQIHSADYKNPAQLPAGGVLVIGAGSSGVQIADELNRSGHPTWLAVGPHHRPPRRYRGRDFAWWLDVLGKWDEPASVAGQHVTIAVSGARGGHTVDFRELAHAGVTLIGPVSGYADGKVQIAPDLAANIAAGDANYLTTLQESDAYAQREGIDLPEEPDAYTIGPDPDCLTHPLAELDLRAAGITTVVWATGYAFDFSWIDIDADLFDAHGSPHHVRGVTAVPGLHFVGLPGLWRRASAFIWGVWHDAAYLADHIAARMAARDAA